MPAVVDRFEERLAVQLADGTVGPARGDTIDRLAHDGRRKLREHHRVGLLGRAEVAHPEVTVATVLAAQSANGHRGEQE